MPTGNGQWRVGDLIAGQYRVLAVHDEGALALVYRVWHAGWEVDLAVKSPRAGLFRGDDRERFVWAAQAWLELGAHPHVCGCYYVRTIDGIPRVFAEYVDGGSLKSRIDDGSLYRGTPREVLARVLDIAVQIAWGLAYTHLRGVVHQDVKPGNVLLDSGGTARITGFGLARQFGTAGSAPGPRFPQSLLVTRAGMTPGYASPEQDAGQPLSPGTDAWGFAASVLEMFTGGVSWRAGTSAGAALEDYLENGPPRPGLPAMPAAVADSLGHCLREDPASRPATMASVAAALTEAYAHELGTGYPRRAARPAQLRAGGLNNKAVSLLELGRAQEARQALTQALEIDPQHPEAVYNQGLLDWRAGQAGDDALLDRLRLTDAGAAGGASKHAGLKAHVLLESGRPDEVPAVLQAAMERAPGEPAVPALSAAAAAMSGDRCPARTSARCTTGHGVDCVDMTPDGRLVLFGGPSNPPPPFLWDSPRRFRLPPGREGRLECCDLVTRTSHEYGGHQAPVTAVGLCADGTRGLSGDHEGKVCLWDTVNGGFLASLEGHRAAVRACRLSADGRLAVTAGWDGTVRWWDTTSPGQPQRVITLEQLAGGYVNKVQDVALSADGRTALVAAWRVELWDLPSGRLLRRLTGRQPIAILPDASRALIADNEGYLRWCDLAGERSEDAAPEAAAPEHMPASQPRVLRLLATGPGLARSAALSANGRLAVSGDGQGNVRWWDLATGRCLRTDAAPPERYPVSVALSADGRTRAVAYTRSASVGPGSMEAGPAPAFGEYTAPYELCRPVPLRDLTDRQDQFSGLLAGARSAMGRRRDREAYGLLVQARDLPGHERDERALAAWDELSSRLPLTGLRGAWPAGVIQLSGGAYGTQTWLSAGIQARLLADGRRALCADRQSLRLWDFDTGRCLQELADHEVSEVTLSPDERTALFRGPDGRVRHWDMETAQILETSQAATGPAEKGAGPDGHQVATADSGDRVRVWQLGDSRLLSAVARQGGAGGPPPAAAAVSLSPDGRFAITGDQDWLVRVLDLRTGRWLQTLSGHTDVIRSVHVGGGGRYAVSTGWDGTLRRWALDWELDPGEVA